MALMKAAQVWEKFILKDLTTFAKYAKVELTPPGPGVILAFIWLLDLVQPRQTKVVKPLLWPPQTDRTHISPVDQGF